MHDIYIYIYIYIYTNIYKHIYILSCIRIYLERERERGKDLCVYREKDIDLHIYCSHLNHICGRGGGKEEERHRCKARV